MNIRVIKRQLVYVDLLHRIYLVHVYAYRFSAFEQFHLSLKPQLILINFFLFVILMRPAEALSTGLRIVDYFVIVILFDVNYILLLPFMLFSHHFVIADVVVS